MSHSLLLGFEADFFDTGFADGVEDAEDLFVAGVFIGGDEDAGIGGGTAGAEAGGDFREGDDGAFPGDDAVGVDGDLIERLLGIGDAGGGFGEVDGHAFHVGHAEADEHEGGEEEEHDVDERDDFDPRFIAMVIAGGVGCEVYGHSFEKMGVMGVMGGMLLLFFGSEGFEVVAVFFCGVDEEFAVVDPAFEGGAEGGDAFAEEVVGEEAEDGDADAGGGGDEGLGDAAGDLAGGELVFIADEAEGTHDADDGAEEAEERGEGDHGADDPHAGFGFLDEVGGVELHGREHGGVGVGDAVGEVVEEGVAGVLGELPGVVEFAGAEGLACGGLTGGIHFRLEAEPPDHAVEEDAEREEEGGKDGPHDPASFDECFDDDVGEHGELAELEDDGALGSDNSAGREFPAADGGDGGLVEGGPGAGGFGVGGDDAAIGADGEFHDDGAGVSGAFGAGWVGGGGHASGGEAGGDGSGGSGGAGAGGRT